MPQLNLTFIDSSYSTSNKPSVNTLKSDLQAIEDNINGNVVTAYTPSGAGTTTVDVSLSRISTVTMPAATQTLAVSGTVDGDVFMIEIINTTSQGALTFFTTIKWVDGLAPTLTGTNGKKDTFLFRQTATGQYDGYIVGQNI